MCKKSVTVSIRKFRIIVLVSNWIEYWSNYSIWFEISNIRTGLITTHFHITHYEYSQMDTMWNSNQQLLPKSSSTSQHAYLHSFQMVHQSRSDNKKHQQTKISFKQKRNVVKASLHQCKSSHMRLLFPAITSKEKKLFYKKFYGAWYLLQYVHMHLEVKNHIFMVNADICKDWKRNYMHGLVLWG